MQVPEKKPSLNPRSFRGETVPQRRSPSASSAEGLFLRKQSYGLPSENLLGHRIWRGGIGGVRVAVQIGETILQEAQFNAATLGVGRLSVGSLHRRIAHAYGVDAVHGNLVVQNEVPDHH